MKRNKGIIFFMLLCLWTGALRAQDGCSMFYPLKIGVQQEHTYYDKNDNVERKTQSVVKEVTRTLTGVEATIINKVLDRRGEEQFSGTYRVRCDNGVVKMDASSILGPGMQQSLSNMEVDVEGEALIIPGTLKTGQQLPDASTNIRAGARGVNVVDMTVHITDRKIAGQESVTTPAGTFDCYKLTQTTEVKMMLDKSFSSVEYYAEGVGLVRSETYDEKGKLEGYMVLTAFEQ